jgi:sulfite exporter TauE/SafE
MDHEGQGILYRKHDQPVGMWVTALVLGFAGSFHCLGMCSPLVTAVTNLRRPYFINRLVYNAGRILCYGLLGAFVSTFGLLLSFSEFQNTLTILLGSALVLIGVAGTHYVHVPVLPHLIHRISVRIRGLFSRFLTEKSIFSMAMLGLLNGLLPCGLTYLALTYCLTVVSPWSGFSFMLVFGAGTLPVMLGFTSLLQSLITRFHFSLRKFSTVAMITLGVLLITRSVYGNYHNHSKPNPPEAIVNCK